MTYETHVIKTRDEIAACPAFLVDNVQWRSTRAPKTSGRMAVLEEKGIYVTMASEDPHPLTTMTRPMDMVCRDSAMEAFFAFPDGPTPLDDDLYFNFEVNAAGAMYAKYGQGRKGRTALTPEEYAATGVWAGPLCGRRYKTQGVLSAPTPGELRTECGKEPMEWVDGWQIGLLLPYSLLQKTAGISRLAPGDVFFCNFYKISEDPGIEHYLSYSPIQSETPNFHLPRFFAKAVVTGCK